MHVTGLTWKERLAMGTIVIAFWLLIFMAIQWKVIFR